MAYCKATRLLQSVAKPVRLLFALALTAQVASAAESSILLQSTTSTANSGLYEHLLPVFKQETGIQVHVIAVGTGQAIRNARNCDADVLLVHAKPAEQAFVAAGYGVARHDLMYNDFVVVGPSSDPAKLRQASSISDALQAVATSQSVFASRGDNSGTHKKELSLWQTTATAPDGKVDRWYRETGSGMGATLNIAVGMQAYTLTDRATWLSFGNRQQHEILYQRDPALFNQYGVIIVNPDHCADSNQQSARVFVDWLLGDRGQQLIGDYRIGDQQLFFPNAGAPSD